MKKEDSKNIDKEEVDKEDIKMGTLELSRADLVADSHLRRLSTKNSMVIAFLLTALALCNLLFIIFDVYTIINARHIIPFMLLTCIIVLYANDYFFKKKLKDIIVHRYIDRIIEEVIDSIKVDSDNKED